MPERSLGDTVQVRDMLEQVADATVRKFDQEHPRAPQSLKADIPAPLKWAAGIISGIMGVGVAAMCFWVVSTLSDLQQTVTRIDERQKLVAQNGDARFVEMDRRVTALEALHRGNNGGKP